ncbi:MAG: lipopolysaccharide heptosyltransferase II [Deltaproteobacteria bacterium RBG_13_60_28]|nr:MAG: lipopolysaccharide heptosyltransferase II [Deltaproteobacteria bacterium RBG_13_60_28]
MAAPGPPRILLVKLSSFGDVLHSLPTLEALRAAFPAGQITWLVEEAYAPLLAGHPALNEVWPVPRVRLGEKAGRGGVLNLLGLMRQVHTSRFDLVIDLQGLLKSALWVALARSPRKVGYDRTRELSYLALTERIPPYDPEAHAVWRYLNVARHLGAPPTLPRFRLGLTPISPDSLVPPDRPLVVLHPGARWPTKLWPAPAWARLGDWLSREKKMAVVITGSAGDREMAAQITGQMREKAWNLAGRTTLAELAGIMQKARLAVTADTGPMHLAAALGAKVVALFGPTAAGRTGPFGEGHRVVRLDLSCSPCFQRRCPDPRCLTALPLDAVQAAVEKSLSRSGNNW